MTTEQLANALRYTDDAERTVGAVMIVWRNERIGTQVERIQLQQAFSALRREADIMRQQLESCLADEVPPTDDGVITRDNVASVPVEDVIAAGSEPEISGKTEERR